MDGPILSESAAELLSAYPSTVQELALKTRAMLLRNLPGVTEHVDRPAGIIGYGFGARYVDLICVIQPTKSGVNLGFYRAMELPDPQKLLEGTGKLHRHVKLKKTQDLRKPGLKALLKSAVAACKRRRNVTVAHRSH